MNDEHWKNVRQIAEKSKRLKLSELFQDKQRVNNYAIDACGIYLDYSKNLIDSDGISALLALANQSKLLQAKDALFSGRYKNETEDRGVGHIALRSFEFPSFSVLGQTVTADIRQQLSRMRQFVSDVHAHRWLGHTGKPISTIVNIGIGGSDLGPKMVTAALKPYVRENLSVHYVSNVDSADLSETLEQCSPEQTLFIICSKSFKTAETLTNAELARSWFLEHGGNTQVLHKHFVGVTINRSDASRFGIHPDQQFKMWDWVGGRFSIWSSIGLSIALALGMDAFIDLLRGAEAMDLHFKTAPLEQNMPVILALLGVWYANGMGAETHAVIPYDYSLRYFTEHLQQLDMESNGKRVDRNGKKIKHTTAPIVWGTAGTNGQHAYFQLMHQGGRLIPSDFILVKKSHYNHLYNQQQLLANGIAQMEALMNGRTRIEAKREMRAQGLDAQTAKALAPYRVFPGNQPSNALVIDKLTPHALGALIALYEHKIFVQGVLWNVNSFDQWGVELGKELAQHILKELDEDLRLPENHDPSTQALINRLLKDK